MTTSYARMHVSALCNAAIAASELCDSVYSIWEDIASGLPCPHCGHNTLFDLYHSETRTP